LAVAIFLAVARLAVAVFFAVAVLLAVACFAADVFAVVFFVAVCFAADFFVAVCFAVAFFVAEVPDAVVAAVAFRVFRARAVAVEAPFADVVRLAADPPALVAEVF
jgi:hypothetical protein